MRRLIFAAAALVVSGTAAGAEEPANRQTAPTAGAIAAVDPVADLPWKKDFQLNSWFAIGHFENGGRKLNFLYHVLTSVDPTGKPFVQGAISITDETSGRYIGEDIVLPLNAAQLSDRNLDVTLPNGSIKGTLDNLRVTGTLKGGSFDVTMRMTSPVLYNGGTGVFPMLDMTVHQYSIPRLATTGTVTLDGKTHEVEGVTWFDRQWQNLNFTSGQPMKWTWMDINLDNGDAISLWSFRDAKLRRELAWATILHADGSQTTTAIEPTSKSEAEHWASDVSGARYPTRWRVKIPKFDAVLDVVSSPKQQEIASQMPMLNKYEGASAITGTYRGKAVRGFGYVELVGLWK